MCAWAELTKTRQKGALKRALHRAAEQRTDAANLQLVDNVSPMASAKEVSKRPLSNFLAVSRTYSTKFDPKFRRGDTQPTTASPRTQVAVRRVINCYTCMITNTSATRTVRVLRGCKARLQCRCEACATYIMWPGSRTRTFFLISFF
jgi:hypothetical protein